MRARICVSALMAAMLLLIISSAVRAQGNGLVASDYQKLRSVGQAEISPDGKLIAYTIVRYDRPGRPWGQLWVMDVATRKSVRIGAENEGSGGAVWSPDGKWIAYMGSAEGKQGLAIVRPDGTGATFLAEVMDTNAPLPSMGASVTWSPDSKQVAFYFGDTGTGNEGCERRSDCAYALHLQARRGRGRFAFQ